MIVVTDPELVAEFYI
jgi:cytochrome P450